MSRFAGSDLIDLDRLNVWVCGGDGCACVADGVAGLAVGVTVGFDGLVGGPLTGASMTPARSLGPAVDAARGR
ncbi:MAG: aquaporin [Longimicrobiales bacterium]